MTQNDSTIVGSSWFFDLFFRLHTAHTSYSAVTRSSLGVAGGHQGSAEIRHVPTHSWVLSERLFASLSFVLLGACSEIFELLRCTSVPEVMSLRILRSCGTLPPDWYKRLESRWRMEGVDTVMTTRSWLHGHDSIMLNHTCPILFLLGHALVDKENDFTSLRPAARFVKVSCFGAEFCVWSRPWPGRNSKRTFIVWLRNWELFSVPKIASDLSRLSFVENSCGILVTVRQDSRIKEAILKPTSKNTANEL